MYNIIKAQMYQLIRENATYYTFLGGLGALLFLYISLSDSNIEIAEVTGSELLVQGTSSMVLMFVAMLFTVRICGGDMGDKTINHEMLTGISRAKIYGGRIIVSVISALIVYICGNADSSVHSHQRLGIYRSCKRSVYSAWIANISVSASGILLCESDIYNNAACGNYPCQLCTHACGGAF